jgi:hypothetical protein
LYSTINDPLTIYVDAAATTLADIQHVDHTTVFQSALMLDGTAIIPQFYGPDGVTDLWAKQPNGPVFQLTAASGPRLDALEAGFLNQSVIYQQTLGAVTANIAYPITHNTNTAYPLVTCWLIETSGVSGIRIPDAQVTMASTSPTSLSLTFSNSYAAGTVQVTVVGN